MLRLREKLVVGGLESPRARLTDYFLQVILQDHAAGEIRPAESLLSHLLYSQEVAFDKINYKNTLFCELKEINNSRNSIDLI